MWRGGKQVEWEHWVDRGEWEETGEVTGIRVRVEGLGEQHQCEGWRLGAVGRDRPLQYYD